MVILNFKQNVKSVSDETIDENINNITHLEFICKLDVKNKLILAPKPKPKPDIGLSQFINNKKIVKKKKNLKKDKYDIDKYDTKKYDIEYKDDVDVDTCYIYDDH
jgi:hypothetical protein